MLDGLETLFLRYGAWSWWLLGLLLLGLEIVMPGFVLVWFGAAAVLIGILALAVDWSVRTLTIVWAILSIVLLIVGRRVMKHSATDSEDPLLNDRAGRLVGRTFTLEEPLGENGGIRGPLLPAGTRVAVRAVEGTVLVVEAA